MSSISINPVAAEPEVSIPAKSHTMQCMEIWGGNQITNNAVTMAGLDAWVYSKPYGASEGGGDVYYVSSCAAGQITRLLIADVSGHGSAVCDVASLLRNLMRRYVNFIDQTRFVRSMNSQFTTLSAAGCFATAIVTTFYAPTGQLNLCNAGHPPPLVYRAKTGQWTFLDQDLPTDPADPRSASNVPLGILDLTEYEQFEVPLAPSDFVLCYTDSLIESRGADGEMLGTQGLLRIVNEIETGAAEKVVPTLLATIERQYPGNLTDDDVTALLFRSNLKTAHVSFFKRVAAPLVVLKGFWDAAWSKDLPAPMPEFTLADLRGMLMAPLKKLRGGPP